MSDMMITIDLKTFEDMSDRIVDMEARIEMLIYENANLRAQRNFVQKQVVVVEAKLQDQTTLIEQLFALLDITEQTDDGRYFKPNKITSYRAMDAEKLNQVLKELKNVLEDRG
jgi:beta-N-acetylglucosaminidase